MYTVSVILVYKWDNYYYRDLHHPNIVNLLAYAIDEEQVVLVTNYVDGTNLERVIFSKSLGQEVISTCNMTII